MKVLCLKSTRGPGISLSNGKEYDLTADQIKAVGSAVLVIEADKPAKKPTRKAPAKKAVKKSTDAS